MSNHDDFIGALRPFTGAPRFTVQWSETGAYGTSAILCKGTTAILLGYDSRDEWLDAKVMNAKDAEALIAARQSRSWDWIPMYDGAQGLSQLLGIRSGGRSNRAGPVPRRALKAAIAKLFRETKRFAPDLLSGTALIDDIVPAPPTITIHSPTDA